MCSVMRVLVVLVSHRGGGGTGLGWEGWGLGVRGASNESSQVLP